MANIYLFHKDLARDGQMKDDANFEALIKSGWVTGPHEFEKTPDEVLSAEQFRKEVAEREIIELNRPKDNILMLYHKTKAPSGEIVAKSDEARLIAEGWVTGPQYFNTPSADELSKIRVFDADEIEGFKAEAADDSKPSTVVDSRVVKPKRR